MTPSAEGGRLGPSMRPAGPRLVRAPRDLVTGLLFTAIGAVGLRYSLEWPTGTPAMMESGFFPQVLSAFVLLSGVILAVKSFVLPGEAMPGIGWRPLLGVTVAVIGFALVIERFGLALAILVIVALSNFAGTPLRLAVSALLWVVLTVMCVAIFIWGVALPLKVWPV